MSNTDRWSALSMKDKADLIKLMVENGITSLDDMKLYYNGGDEKSVYGGELEPAIITASPSTLIGKSRPKSRQKMYDSVKERIIQQAQAEQMATQPKIGEQPLQPLTYNIVQNAPVVGDALMAGEAANAVKEGNIKEAAILAGALLLPNALNGTVKGLLHSPQVVKDMNGFTRKGSQFRIVDKPAIEDAIESRVIRSKTGLYHGVPEYLRENFSEYLEKIPNWETMDASDIREALEKLGAFSNMTNTEKNIAKFNIRNSTNHGNTVGYFKDTPYPNYTIGQKNYVIETPSSSAHFAPGHHGKIFDWPLESRKTGATVLIDENGIAKGASIPVDGSVYWEFNPEIGGWITKNFKYGGGIHINPKNKGKFNATKKRTGKTTEELTHSKNPLTRKRAIFAQNAKKWNHKHSEGGPLGDLDTLNHPKYNAASEEAMYNYLSNSGLNDAQVSGIMGNLAVESLLNSNINQFNGPAYGFIQAEGARKKALKAYQGDPYVFGSGLLPEEQKQLDYIINMGINNYTPGEWGKQGYSGARAARKAFLDSSDVNEASDIITRNYLRPNKPHTKRRRDMSEYYFNKYGHKDWDFTDSEWNLKNILKK